MTGAVKVARWAAAPPSRKQSPACPYSHGSEEHQTHSHLVYKTSLWSFCWVPEMISPITKSFSSISVIFEIKAAVWGRLDDESSRSRGSKCKTGDSQRSTQVSVWWSNMQNRLWPWVAHRLGVQGASLWKKTFQLLVDRPYGILETNCTLEEGSGKTLIRQREKGREKQERHGVVPVPVVPLERGVLSRQTAVAVETIKRAISSGVLPLMSLIILLLTFCALICILQRHRPHHKLRSSF